MLLIWLASARTEAAYVAMTARRAARQRSPYAGGSDTEHTERSTMRDLKRQILTLLVLATALLLAPASARADFPLKDGDVWVMAGDSITAQHLHSNYFEAFCFARYPNLKFAFRNSGVGGHTIPSTCLLYTSDAADE